jgi:hypothetical protein
LNSHQRSQVLTELANSILRIGADQHANKSALLIARLIMLFDYQLRYYEEPSTSLLKLIETSLLNVHTKVILKRSSPPQPPSSLTSPGSVDSFNLNDDVLSSRRSNKLSYLSIEAIESFHARLCKRDNSGEAFGNGIEDNATQAAKSISSSNQTSSTLVAAGTVMMSSKSIKPLFYSFTACNPRALLGAESIQTYNNKCANRIALEALLKCIDYEKFYAALLNLARTSGGHASLLLSTNSDENSTQETSGEEYASCVYNFLLIWSLLEPYTNNSCGALPAPVKYLNRFVSDLFVNQKTAEKKFVINEKIIDNIARHSYEYIQLLRLAFTPTLMFDSDIREDDVDHKSLKIQKELVVSSLNQINDYDSFNTSGSHTPSDAKFTFFNKFWSKKLGSIFVNFNKKESSIESLSILFNSALLLNYHVNLLQKQVSCMISAKTLDETLKEENAGYNLVELLIDLVRVYKHYYKRYIIVDDFVVANSDTSKSLDETMLMLLLASSAPINTNSPSKLKIASLSEVESSATSSKVINNNPTSNSSELAATIATADVHNSDGLLMPRSGIHVSTNSSFLFTTSNENNISRSEVASGCLFDSLNECECLRELRSYMKSIRVEQEHLSRELGELLDGQLCSRNGGESDADLALFVDVYLRCSSDYDHSMLLTLTLLKSLLDLLVELCTSSDSIGSNDLVIEKCEELFIELYGELGSFEFLNKSVSRFFTAYASNSSLVGSNSARIINKLAKMSDEIDSLYLTPCMSQRAKLDFYFLSRLSSSTFAIIDELCVYYFLRKVNKTNENDTKNNKNHDNSYTNDEQVLFNYLLDYVDKQLDTPHGFYGFCDYYASKRTETNDIKIKIHDTYAIRYLDDASNQVPLEKNKTSELEREIILSESIQENRFLLFLLTSSKLNSNQHYFIQMINLLNKLFTISNKIQQESSKSVALANADTQIAASNLSLSSKLSLFLAQLTHITILDDDFLQNWLSKLVMPPSQSTASISATYVQSSVTMSTNSDTLSGTSSQPVPIRPRFINRLSDPLEIKFVLKQLIIHLSASKNSSVASCILNALIKVANKLLKQNDTTGFAELISLMDSLASSNDCSGHLSLFNACCKWLEYFSSQNSDRLTPQHIAGEYIGEATFESVDQYQQQKQKASISTVQTISYILSYVGDILSAFKSTFLAQSSNTQHQNASSLFHSLKSIDPSIGSSDETEKLYNQKMFFDFNKETMNVFEQIMRSSNASSLGEKSRSNSSSEHAKLSTSVPSTTNNKRRSRTIRGSVTSDKKETAVNKSSHRMQYFDDYGDNFFDNDDYDDQDDDGNEDGMRSSAPNFNANSYKYENEENGEEETMNDETQTLDENEENAEHMINSQENRASVRSAVRDSQGTEALIDENDDENVDEDVEDDDDYDDDDEDDQDSKSDRVSNPVRSRDNASASSDATMAAATTTTTANNIGNQLDEAWSEFAVASSNQAAGVLTMESSNSNGRQPPPPPSLVNATESNLLQQNDQSLNEDYDIQSPSNAVEEAILNRLVNRNILNGLRNVVRGENTNNANNHNEHDEEDEEDDEEDEDEDDDYEYGDDFTDNFVDYVDQNVDQNLIRDLVAVSNSIGSTARSTGSVEAGTGGSTLRSNNNEPAPEALYQNLMSTISAAAAAISGRLQNQLTSSINAAGSTNNTAPSTRPTASATSQPIKQANDTTNKSAIINSGIGVSTGNKSATTTGLSSDSTSATNSIVYDADDLSELNAKLCTYTVTKKDFMNQHWYYCHTCKMIDRIGMCTVCAKVCHKDHDVSYAKYGSFFCDCGAKEDGSCMALVKRNTQSGNSSAAGSKKVNSGPSASKQSTSNVTAKPVSTKTSKSSSGTNKRAKQATGPVSSTDSNSLSKEKAATLSSNALQAHATTAISITSTVSINRITAIEMLTRMLQSLRVNKQKQTEKLKAKLVEIARSTELLKSLRTLLDTTLIPAARIAYDSSLINTNTLLARRQLGKLRGQLIELPKLNGSSSQSKQNEDTTTAGIVAAATRSPSMKIEPQQLFIVTLGSQEGAFENVRMTYTGEHGPLIKQLVQTHAIRRVSMCCLASANKKHLIVTHEKVKSSHFTVLQLNALLKQDSNKRNKLTLTKLNTIPVPFTLMSVVANACNEDYIALNGLKDCHVMYLNESGQTKQEIAAAAAVTTTATSNATTSATSSINPSSSTGTTTNTTTNSLSKTTATVTTDNSSGLIVLHPSLEGSNYIIKSLWLPGSQTELALITSEFIKIYDLSVDKISPVYYFLLPMGKIKDATFVYDTYIEKDQLANGNNDDEINASYRQKKYILIMSSCGYLYYEEMNELTSAKNGIYYVTNTIDFNYEQQSEQAQSQLTLQQENQKQQTPPSSSTKTTNAKSNSSNASFVYGGGVSVYYSFKLRLLFWSYMQGKTFIGSFKIRSLELDTVFPLIAPINSSSPGSKSSSTVSPPLNASQQQPQQALCQWSEIPAHFGLVMAMTLLSNNPIILMFLPDRIYYQEIKVTNNMGGPSKAKIQDMVATRHSSSVSSLYRSSLGGGGNGEDDEDVEDTLANGDSNNAELMASTLEDGSTLNEAQSSR